MLIYKNIFNFFMCIHYYFFNFIKSNREYDSSIFNMTNNNIDVI